MPEMMTASFFEQQTEFVVRGDAPLALSVVEVKRLALRPVPGDWGEPDRLPPRQPFSVIFRGPMQPRLRQGMVELIASDESLSNIFLVPIAQDSKGIIYEAVFN